VSTTFYEDTLSFLPQKLLSSVGNFCGIAVSFDEERKWLTLEKKKG
jgi:hypothetical protein